jgi:hypothetical protein
LALERNKKVKNFGSRNCLGRKNFAISLEGFEPSSTVLWAERFGLFKLQTKTLLLVPLSVFVVF